MPTSRRTILQIRNYKIVFPSTEMRAQFVYNNIAGVKTQIEILLILRSDRDCRRVGFTRFNRINIILLEPFDTAIGNFSFFFPKIIIRIV